MRNSLRYPFYRNLSLKKKLLFSYILLIVIPLVILGFYSYYYFSNTLYEKVVISSQESNAQIVKNIDNFLTSLSKISEFPSLDDTVSSILRKDYSKSENKFVEILNDVEAANASLYKGVFYMNEYIGSVTVVPNNIDYVFNVSIIPKYTISYPDKSQKWYQNILKAEAKAVIFGIHRDFLQSDGEYVISVGRSIVDPFTNKSYGVTVLNVKADRIMTLWKDISLTPESKFAVIDNKNNIIYGSGIGVSGENISTIPGFSKVINQDGSTETTIDGEDVYLNIATSELYQWRVVSITPKDELFSEIYNIRDITVLLCIVLILLALSVSTIIATGITRPVLKLKNSMISVENGDLNVTSSISGGEIGELSSGFNRMISKMRNLIQKIYEQETEKRNAEIIALQSQISPHFLYNTLNTIKWMAKIQGSTGIVNALGSLIQLLTFASKNTDNLISIREELEQLNYYFDIMNLRFNDKFSVEYKIDDEALECMTLKFLLQPIVENAIIHGFEDLSGNGIINITIVRNDDRIIYDVIDNGKGIDRETVRKILYSEEYSSKKKFSKIGLYNVNKRIKLEFGESYGVEILAEDGENSRVHVEIPAILITGEEKNEDSDC
ncbi:sensor histidine kinase [Ruminiclostridium papyrosolvens]|uniref:HAMP domain-containing protein n=1 Tax=Ruminiclostridium papyrosolvens C7 TaxID=1330534 RepID=U4R6C6_9FIRM|nr:sensor histidine kinase [Ruminiclostridium papyrosolvens]EPR14048.1 hypothetical protein L323_01510 [Ruminiclostridium papyrosolvens C7]